jgi:hypothetical protein
VAFAAGGPLARLLADRPVFLTLNDTLFVHAGLLPSHVATGLQRYNDVARAYLLGDAHAYRDVVELLMDEDSPLWTRTFASNVSDIDCMRLEESLAALNVSRVVVGHSVQWEGISSVCSDRLWRVDVGLSAIYQTVRTTPLVEILEIVDGDVRVLSRDDRS